MPSSEPKGNKVLKQINIYSNIGGSGISAVIIGLIQIIDDSYPITKRVCLLLVPVFCFVFNWLVFKILVKQECKKYDNKIREVEDFIKNTSSDTSIPKEEREKTCKDWRKKREFYLEQKLSID